MPPRYAENTKVPVEKSEAELKLLLRKHGADKIATGTDDTAGLAVVSFSITGRVVRLQVSVPSVASLQEKFSKVHPHGWQSWTPAKRKEYVIKHQDQLARQRWRSLVLLCKAKLEAVAEGLSTIEREFLADLMLPNGSTMHQNIEEKLKVMYLQGRMPSLPLLGGV